MDYAFIGGSAELEEVTVKGFVKFDLPVTINRHVTLFDSNDFVSVILQDKTYVYVKSIDTWFPFFGLHLWILKIQSKNYEVQVYKSMMYVVIAIVALTFFGCYLVIRIDNKLRK